MTEDKKHQLDESSVTDILSYLNARVSSMEEQIHRQGKQINKAREIIEVLIDSLETIDSAQVKELLTVQEAKQFLKEVG